MRISDWSSDVCSSDLDPRLGSALARRGLATSQVNGLGLVLKPVPHQPADIQFVIEDACPAGAVAVDRVLAPDAAAGADDPIGVQDWKRVVSGKCVSVRVALGWRRVIKKKQTKNN